MIHKVEPFRLRVFILLLSAGVIDYFKQDDQAETNKSANGRVKLIFIDLVLNIADDDQNTIVSQWSKSPPEKSFEKLIERFEANFFEFLF